MALNMSGIATTLPYDTPEGEWVDVAGDIEVTKDDSDIAQVDVPDEQDNFYTRIASAGRARLEKDPSPIFLVDDLPLDLWSTWLDSCDPSYKKQYDCTTCRRFVKRYGGLVQLDETGGARPVMWPSPDENFLIPEHLRAPLFAIYKKVAAATVLDEFKVTPKHQTVGTRTFGGYNHFYLDFPVGRLHKPDPMGFAYASVADLATMLDRAIKDYSLDAVRQVATMLTEDKLPYADSHKAAIRWFLDLRENKIEKYVHVRGGAYHNLLYLYAASAFRGCLNQWRSGALSTLLQDTEAGHDFATIKVNWMKICDPGQYLRPQALPTQGNIDAAERLMVSLGVTANYMRRRQCTMSDVPQSVIMWASRENQSEPCANPGGLFSEVETKHSVIAPISSSKKLNLPPKRMTFTRLVTDILPNAIKLEYKTDTHNPLYFCLTGLEGTKPLMKWHNETNKVSWFVHNPSPRVTDHNLLPNAWNEVSHLLPLPHLWDGLPHTTRFPLASPDSDDFKYYHKSHGFRYMFCLKNLEHNRNASLCLFPELLKSEFHGIRRTIEAYSRGHNWEKVPDIKQKGGLLAGIVVHRSMSAGTHLLRVTNNKGDMDTYEIVLFE